MLCNWFQIKIVFLSHPRYNIKLARSKVSVPHWSSRSSGHAANAAPLEITATFGRIQGSRCRTRWDAFGRWGLESVISLSLNPILIQRQFSICYYKNQPPMTVQKVFSHIVDLYLCMYYSINCVNIHQQNNMRRNSCVDLYLHRMQHKRCFNCRICYCYQWFFHLSGRFDMSFRCIWSIYEVATKYTNR